MSITGHEYNAETMEPTGRTEVYHVDTVDEAIRCAVYTHALKQPTHVGPTGRAIYYGAFCMSFPTPKTTANPSGWSEID